MKDAKRGFVPSDEREFGDKAIPKLRQAAEEVLFLLNHGYPVKGATRFVGDHYMFSERQRLALARTVSPEEQIASRLSREVKNIEGETIYIDGFNVIIGLEIAFSESMLFTCMDGTIRDLAGLRGTYRLIPETDLAVKALLKTLEKLKVGKAVIYLDKPVSNSGRLKQKINEYAEDVDIEVEVEIEDAVDYILKQKPLIASGDAIILDACDKWFNLVRCVIEDNIEEYPYIDICPKLR
ncbi:MAG: DUF434 domain-containing protein [Butyrivibrio hungatei]|nr:DUF434 domain-containing protein [Butyrivibrio hungatei]